MPLGKPDVTKFDSDDDSIKDARPEIQTAFTSLNTMIDEYTANGDTFGSGLPPRTYTTIAPVSETTIDFNGGFAIYDIQSQETVNFEVSGMELGKVHYLAWISTTANTGLVKIVVNGSTQESSANDTSLKVRKFTPFEVNPDSYDSAGENFYFLKEGFFANGPYTR